MAVRGQPLSYMTIVNMTNPQKTKQPDMLFLEQNEYTHVPEKPHEYTISHRILTNPLKWTGKKWLVALS